MPTFAFTYIIIAVNVLMSVIAWNNANLKQKWIFHPLSIARNGEYLRFLTSGFIHADGMHLFFNMFALFSFGLNVEFQLVLLFGEMGRYILLVIYLLAVVASDLPSYFKHKNDVYYSALGASGAVSAMIFASIYFSPLSKISLYFIPIPGFIFGILYLIYCSYMVRNSNDNIGHDAHFYGSVFGFFAALSLNPSGVDNFITQIASFTLLK